MNFQEDNVFLLVNKPLTWTSFDVVKKLKFALRPKKIGHAGTLDPLATGLLVLGLNKNTKKIDEVQGASKTYTGIIEIGKTTPSYDLETAYDSETNCQHVRSEDVLAAAKKLTGFVTQVPPIYSAVKVDGERAYKKARRNEEVKLKERVVEISSFEVTEMSLPEIHFKIDCSKGTYIRSLANDMGKILGVGAHLKALCRTRIGDYHLKDAYQLEDLVKWKDADS
ncbi:MAG: tRNA pseudouridine55 synthase [Cyclobacteriaceae bacterium]|jgi:tRNA pseudouridine55 synthase